MFGGKKLFHLKPDVFSDALAWHRDPEQGSENE